MGVVFAVDFPSWLSLLSTPACVFLGLALGFGEHRWKRRRSPPRSRLNLHPWQMRQANVIVRRGERVDDPALAPAVIRSAARVMRPQFLERYSWLMALALSLVGLAGAVLDFDAGDTVGALWSSLFCLCMFAAVFGFGPWRRHQIKNAQHARDYATRLL